MHEFKFVSFSPVNLSCVNLISPATTTQVGKRGKFSPSPVVGESARGLAGPVSHSEAAAAERSWDM